MEEREIYRLPSRAWLDVDTGALVRNVEALQRATGAAPIPMVKANAYGLGMAGVVAALEELDPWAYGVATVDEGVVLRELVGENRRIIVFSPMVSDEREAAHGAGLEPALGSIESIEAWNRAAGATEAPYHLAIDTGMNRAGAPWRSAGDLVDIVDEFPPESVFTHFHSADLDDGSAAQQSKRFDHVVAELGLDSFFRHTDNSAAAARSTERWDGFRPGVFMYGAGGGPLAPEPVARLCGRVVELRWIEPGDTVSYRATYSATRRERIATVSVGYADGYPRELSNKATAGIDGVPISQRGLVTMDMTMFDVTGVDCAVGDVVTLIGTAEDGAPTLDETAALAGISPYALLTGFSARLARRYFGAQNG